MSQSHDRAGMDDQLSTVSSWLSEQAKSVEEVQTASKSSRSRNGSLRPGPKEALISTQVLGCLERSASEVSTDSTASAASTSSRGTWSPRTAADTESRSNVVSRKSRRARASLYPGTKQGSGVSSTVTADLQQGLPRESSILSAASFDSDASLEHSILPRLSSNLSPAKLPRRGSAASLQSQHSILDPLPEKATDAVRQRKVFGSTYSVGKLGELPATPSPRTRSSLTQPPWVTAAKGQAATATTRKDKLITASSVQGASTADVLPDLHHTADKAEPHLTLGDDRHHSGGKHYLP